MIFGINRNHYFSGIFFPTFSQKFLSITHFFLSKSAVSLEGMLAMEAALVAGGAGIVVTVTGTSDVTGGHCGWWW